jgi:hypothetical protein
MPKELTHWWLAAEALQQLPPGRPISNLLKAEQAAWLLGAVLPDTLMHLVRGPWSAIALKLAHDFHEPQGNSFAPLVRFVEQQSLAVEKQPLPAPASSDTPLAPATLACLLGVAAHMEADIVFHPYICALSGDDLGQHYRFETELDLKFLQEGKKPPVRHLKELLKSQNSSVAVTVAQGIFDPHEELPRDVIQQALHLHSRIQSMYDTPGWQLLARFLALLPVHGLRCRQKLFYPLSPHKEQNVAWPGQWRHPSTGELRYDTPEELATTAIDRIVQLVRRVDEEGVLTAFKEQAGENLVTGLPMTHVHTPTAVCVTAQP